MAAPSRNDIDVKLLRGLKPINELSLDKLEELAAKSSIDELPAGRLLFRQGEKDRRIIYLLSGQVELSVTGNPITETIKARTSEAEMAIAPTLPRSCSAKTKTKCKLLFIDCDLLEILQSDESSVLIEVEELSADDDSAWMLRFLQSRAFLKLPTDTIQNLLITLEEVPISAGEVIISQGDSNDYYYIVQSGSCEVTRRPAPKVAEVQIAVLNAGDGFGEEALITGGRRNANIRMLEAGTLMRLDKKNFMTLLAKPLISYIDNDEVVNKVNSGALVIDVRLHDEFSHTHADGAINIPLTMLRLKLDGFNQEREYILVCDDGNRSSAAAFLLTQHGLNCFVLQDGMNENALSLPGANHSASIGATSGNRKSVAAEKTKKAAEAQASKIQQEAETAKTQARNLAKRAADAEAAKKKAEKDLQRLQKEEASKREAVLKAAKQRLSEESNNAKSAEDRAAKLKLEAKNAKRRAEQELEKLRAETRANTERQSALENSLSQAKTIATEAAKKAKQAKETAEKEAKIIRKQAQQESEKLRKDMEQTLKRMEKDAERAQAKQTQQHQAALQKVKLKAVSEAERIRAEAKEEAQQLRSKISAANSAAKLKATKLAEQEAERIRLEALEEAKSLRNEIAATRNAAKQEAQAQAMQEAEHIRLEALQEVEQLRADIAATRDAAKQEATKLAGQEAERIRFEALQEAEQLRIELEAAKNQAQNIAASVAAQEIEQKQMLDEARRQAEEITRTKTLEAEQYANQVRQQATDEARRLKQEVQTTRQLLEKQKQQVQAQQQQAKRKDQQRAEDKKRHVAEEKVHQLSSKKKADEMRRRAEAIKSRLEKAEQVRQADEARHQAAGMSLSKATLKRVHNRIILEGDEDIFIFKEPSAAEADAVEIIADTEEPHKEQATDDLPSFVIETPEEENYVPVSREEINETFERHFETETSFKKQRNRKVFAIAASVVMTAVLGISLFIFQPEDKVPHLASTISAVDEQQASISKPRFNAAKFERKKKAEQARLKRQATERFDRLKLQWEQKRSQPSSEVSDNNSTSFAFEQAPQQQVDVEELAFEQQAAADGPSTASSLIEELDANDPTLTTE